MGRISHKAWAVFKEKHRELTFTVHAFSTDDDRRKEFVDMGHKLQGSVIAQEHSSTDNIEEEGQQNVAEVMKESFNDVSAGKRLRLILERLKQPRSTTWALHLGDAGGLSKEDWRLLARSIPDTRLVTIGTDSPMTSPSLGGGG